MNLNLSGLKAATTALLGGAGQLLAVTRPQKIGVAARTIQVLMHPQAISPKQAQSLQLEGKVNILEDKPHAFYFDFGPDVINGDEIAYNSETYEILTVTPAPGGGQMIKNMAVAKLYKGPS